MTIEQIFDEIYLNEKTQDPDVFISIYEQNISFIESNLNILQNNHYDKLMRLVADYAHMLTIKKKFEKALPKLSYAITLFENHSAFTSKEPFKIAFYEVLIFDRAITNFYLGNFLESRRDFINLSKHFPENIKYKSWLKTIQYQRFRNIEIALIAIMIISLFLNKFVFKTHFMHVFFVILEGCALAAFLGVEILKRK